MTLSDASQPQPARLPWALIGAILLMIGFEVGLRFAPWPGKIHYELGGPEYQAVAAAMDVGDPPEVLFVGSSRARESIDIPTLRPILEKAVGRPVTVANYATSGGRMVDFEAVIRRVAREPNLPRIIAVGVSERDLGPGTPTAFDNVPIFWNLRDLHLGWKRRGAAVLEFVPIAVRNQVATQWRALQLREQLRMAASEAFVGTPAEGITSPVSGEMTYFHTTEKRKSLATKPISRDRVRQYIRTMRLDPYPSEDMIASLEGLIRTCRETRVTLILYEVPTPDLLQENLPGAIRPKFLSIIQKAADNAGVSFFTPERLRVRLGDNHYREQSHMNIRGARAFSTIFGTKVLARVLTRTPEDIAADAAEARRRKKRRAAATTRAN